MKTRHPFECALVLMICLAGYGCVNRTTEVTRVATPKYRSISGRTFVTTTNLFLVEDRALHCEYILPPHPQDVPRSPQDFRGEEIPVPWGKRSSITDVVPAGTSLIVDHIEYVSSPTMNWDRISASLLTSSHAGKRVRVERLFHQSDRPDRPIQPKSQYLREKTTGE